MLPVRFTGASTSTSVAPAVTCPRAKPDVKVTASSAIEQASFFMKRAPDFANQLTGRSCQGSLALLAGICAEENSRSRTFHDGHPRFVRHEVKRLGNRRTFDLAEGGLTPGAGERMGFGQHVSIVSVNVDQAEHGE